MTRSGATQAARFHRHREVREDMLDAYLFIIDEQEKAIHALEGIGIAVWRLTAEPMSAREIAGGILEAFPDVPEARIAADVRRMLKDLELFALVRRV